MADEQTKKVRRKRLASAFLGEAMRLASGLVAVPMDDVECERYLDRSIVAVSKASADVPLLDKPLDSPGHPRKS